MKGEECEIFILKFEAGEWRFWRRYGVESRPTQLACLSSRVLEKKIKYHMWIFFCGWGQKTYQQPCNFISILTDIFNTCSCSVFFRTMSLKTNRRQCHIFLSALVMSKFVNCNIFSVYWIAKLWINFELPSRCFDKPNALLLVSNII